MCVDSRSSPLPSPTSVSPRRPQNVLHSIFCTRIIFQLLKHRKRFLAAGRRASSSGRISSTNPDSTTQDWVTGTDPDNSQHYISTIVAGNTMHSDAYELEEFADSRSSTGQLKTNGELAYEVSQNRYPNPREHRRYSQPSEWYT